jgi:hypothetical protein
VAAGLVSTGCGTEQSAALRVGDQSVSQSELFEELEFITTNEDFRSALFEGVQLSDMQGTLRTSYTQPFVGAMLDRRLRFLLAGEALDANGIEITDADRADIEQQLDDIPGAEEMPAGYREDFVEGFARLSVLQSASGDEAEINSQLREAAQSTEILVNSRFGTWDADNLIIEPPPAPAGASDEAEAGTGAE